MKMRTKEEKLLLLSTAVIIMQSLCTYIDSNLIVKESLHYVPVTRKAYWEFHMEKLLVNNDSVACLNGCIVVVDTCTSMIMGPVEDVAKINALLPGTEIFYGIKVVHCDNVDQLPDITFEINGKSYTLQGEDYVMEFSFLFLSICVSGSWEMSLFEIFTQFLTLNKTGLHLLP